MSLTFKQFYLEILGTLANKVPLDLAKRFVNRAWKDIRDSRQWSFLNAEGVLYSPGLINSGSFSVTQFSSIITANAAAITALNNLNNPVITKRQIRFGGGPIYNIKVLDPSFSSNGLIYLDRPYKEATNTSAPYMVYRCYYSGPEVTTVDVDGVATTTEATDFLRYNSIYSYNITRYFTMLHGPRELLNRWDVRRSSLGNAYYLFSYPPDSGGNPQFEMWPHPSSSTAYLCSFQRKGVDFVSDSETLPTIIPDDLLMERAMQYACEFAMKNVGKYKEFQGTNWNMAMLAHKKAYSNISSADPGLLEIAQRNDEEAFPQNQITQLYAPPVGTDDRMVYELVGGVIR